MEKHKTVIKAFRLREDYAKILEEEAKRRGVTVSYLVNKALRRFIEYERFIEGIKDVSLSQLHLRKIVEAADKNLLAKIGKELGKDVPLAIVAAKYGDLTVENVLKFLQDIGNEYTKVFNTQVISHQDKIVLTIEHELGHKWSIHVLNYIESLFEALNIKYKRMAVTERTVTFTIPQSQISKNLSHVSTI
jgi:hypothetical protein